MDSISRKAGGVLQANINLAHALRRCGDDVVVVGGRDEFSEVDRPDWGSISVTEAPCLGPRRFGYAPGMKHLLLNSNADLLHSHGIWTYSSLAALQWKRKYRRPEVVHPHGMFDRWAVQNSSFKKRLVWSLFESRHLRHADCIRALSYSEIESIRDFGLTNPVCLIPNGIELPREIANENVGDKRLSGKKMLLYLGRIHPKKGLENLVRAWGLAEQDDWILAIAGWDEGGHEKSLQNLATDCGIPWSAENQSSSDKIVFLGPQFGKSKRALYENCEAFILPSFSEGLPMVILEAWAHAKPVIMTPMCNLPEGVPVGAALITEPRVQDLVTVLNQMMKLSDEQRSTMGNAGRQLVAERFTWNRVAEQLHAVQEWLVHQSSSPPDCVRF